MELEVYPHIVALARRVIAEAFSNSVIVPGVTTNDDVRWWMRQRVAELDRGDQLSSRRARIERIRAPEDLLGVVDPVVVRIDVVCLGSDDILDVVQETVTILVRSVAKESDLRHGHRVPLTVRRSRPLEVEQSPVRRIEEA